MAVLGGDPQPHSWRAAFFACAFKDHENIPLTVAMRGHICGTMSALVQRNISPSVVQAALVRHHRDSVHVSPAMALLPFVSFLSRKTS